MKKVFGIFALALALVACNKNEMDLQSAEQPSDNMITITATLAPKTAGTKAVADNSDGKITVTWAVDEHLAILYTKDGSQMADAEIAAVDGSGAATITFGVVDGTPDNTDCTIIYPYSAAKDDRTGVKDAATLLAAQDGTLNANLDVRVGEGKIQITTPGLDVTTQPAAQFAIFKFTVRLYDGTTVISARPLTVTIGTDTYTITPATATDVLYAALPAVSGVKVSFDATDGSDRTYTCAKRSVSFEAGKYYQSPLKMREYVDMGNGLKWATSNIGADSPDAYGDYYAWGATATQTSYAWASYPFMQAGQSDWKHITKDTFADGQTGGICTTAAAASSAMARPSWTLRMMLQTSSGAARGASPRTRSGHG